MWNLLFALPLMILLILFAITNTQPVSVGLWPLDLAWRTSLATAVLLAAALAFLMGAAVAWAAHAPERRRLRELARAGRLLEAELSELRAREAKRVEAEALATELAPPVRGEGRAVAVVR